MRLLLVDDDDAQIHWLEKQFLSVDDHDVFSCYKAKEALEIYKAVAPKNSDSVITDYQMPGMTGVQLIEEVRKLNPEQHVILQTSETKLWCPAASPNCTSHIPLVHCCGC